MQLRAIHDLLPKLTKKEGMEVIVPEEKDKIHLLEYEKYRKEENETRDTLREELLENVQNFKAEPDKKDSGVSGDIRTSDYSGASCPKRRRRQVAHSGCSHQETADGKKRSSGSSEKKGKKKNGV